VIWLAAQADGLLYRAVLDYSGDGGGTMKASLSSPRVRRGGTRGWCAGILTQTLRALCLFFGAAVLLGAQTATGRLSGSVVDPEGLPVPGAKITLTGESTGITLTAVTNPLGAF
jgi:hypothetical protein